MTDWKGLIGKRVLLRSKALYNIVEVEVLEVSPSGDYVKLRYMSSKGEIWEDCEDLERLYTIAEVLD